MNHIKDKEYVQKFKNEYHKILAIAICYDFKLKEHRCIVEEI